MLINMFPRRPRHFTMLVFATLLNLAFFTYMYYEDRSPKELLDKLDIIDYKKLLDKFQKPTQQEVQEFDEVIALRVQKRLSTDFDKFWIVDTSLKVTETVLPESLDSNTYSFDLRATLGLTINYIKTQYSNSESTTINFHWYDWVDLTKLNPYLTLEQKKNCDVFDIPNLERNLYEKNRVTKVSSYCVDDSHVDKKLKDGNKIRPGFNVFAPSGATTKELRSLEGKSFLYTYAPSPFSIIFMTRNGSIIVDVDQTEKRKLIDSSLLQTYKESHQDNVVNPLSEWNDLLSVHPLTNEESISGYTLELSHELFVQKHVEIIKTYNSMSKSQYKNLSMGEQNYANSLRYSDSISIGDTPKYFSEAEIIKREHLYGLGGHYDWRFFNGFINNSYEQSIVLHRLLRGWLNFTRNHGLISWIAHGSLLGWYWDGLSFPWDNDIDVQMPLDDLNELARRFNQSIIVEDIREGMGRFFLDCGTFITQRGKGNGKNNIDARLIDIDTGLYIDITGLSLTDTFLPNRYRSRPSTMQKRDAIPSKQRASRLNQAQNAESLSTPEGRLKLNTKFKAYNCRNNHFLLLSELSPLRLSMVEGVPAYIPKDYESVLRAEYATGLSKQKFQGYTYVPSLRLWVNTGIIKKYLKQPVGRKSIIELKEEDYLQILEADELLIEYYLSKDITNLHQQEMERWGRSEETRDLVQGTYFPPMRQDLFQYRLAISDPEAKAAQKKSNKQGAIQKTSGMPDILLQSKEHLDDAGKTRYDSSV